MNIAIIDYKAGNVQSVIYALKRLGVEPVLTNDPAVIKAADKVIFPGVGEARMAMKNLKAHGLDTLIPTLTQPVLGICIGLQLMCAHSEEGDTPCMNIFPLKVKKFPVKDSKGRSYKVPHMGWNTLQFKGNPLFKGIDVDAFVYYVHSFYAEHSKDFAIATSEYSQPYSAALHRDNFYAVQFHPEKSGDIGAQLLKNFVEM
ncbi:MAG: imidazole glycerol phosphate synthase subunit HisH [Cyclobacteriaceae bacterium]